nr:MAG TPA: hypothetical protein [Caudoviricetes sp.]
MAADQLNNLTAKGKQPNLKFNQLLWYNTLRP